MDTCLLIAACLPANDGGITPECSAVEGNTRIPHRETVRKNANYRVQRGCAEVEGPRVDVPQMRGSNGEISLGRTRGNTVLPSFPPPPSSLTPCAIGPLSDRCALGVGVSWPKKG